MTTTPDDTPEPAIGADLHAPGTRSIELEVEVVGTPEQVWEAIASGPGITAWFVPTTVEPGVGGVVSQSFGEGDEMQVEGRVRVWEPPARFAYGGFEEGPDATMAFEFLVEARGSGSCVVRLVNSGFGEGDEWDHQYDSMSEGWGIFLQNLQLHLELFPGRAAHSLLPMATASGGPGAAWNRLASALGIEADPVPGAAFAVAGSAPAPLAGTVHSFRAGKATVVLTEPAEGTGFLAVEGTGDEVSVSVWLYLYGPEGAEAAARDQSLWQAWLSHLFLAPGGATSDGSG